MQIRKAKECDLPQLLEVYAIARGFMKEAGNPNQWKGGYPTEADILRDISEECLYVVENNQELAAAFYFRIGEDIHPIWSVRSVATRHDARTATSPSRYINNATARCATTAVIMSR